MNPSNPNTTLRSPFAGGASHYAVFFEDPDRIKVEVVAPK
jgi:hypothetical protein